MRNTEKSMEKIVELCKRRGFVYPGSEIYGGLANAWDYGPLGVELKNNIKKAWWKAFVQKSPYNEGLDSAILMNSAVWEASGHVGGFVDPLMDCRSCKTRHRADTLIEDATGVSVSGWSQAQMTEFLREKNIVCPNCGSGDFTDIRQFNMMFKTFLGVTEESKSELYLRPETAQGIFVNFKNIARSTRRKLPFGVCQIGKSFRNEITPRNFIFRTREFEQMEMEFFCAPEDGGKWFEYWKGECFSWLREMGLREGSLRMRDHEKEELSHYSTATTDFEFEFAFGWGELWGIANRTDFDLTQHEKHSGESMEYYDQENDRRFIPHVIEPSLGADRVLLAFLTDAYTEERLENDDRLVLKLHPSLTPYKCAVLPLSKKLAADCEPLCAALRSEMMVDYDDAGSIGKRYRRQDEIGTPYCVTYDFESQNDHCVTIRDRDTMSQERIPVEGAARYIMNKTGG